MVEHTAMLDNVLANPHDPNPRLVFADYLQDRNNPLAARLRVDVSTIREVESITAEQAEFISPVKDHWFQVDLDTGPCDHAEAEHFVELACRVAKL